MHNRARLVVGSFLTKDLGIDWRWGERWFMRMLIDGDEANNNGNWQWIASVGTDPQPAFRRIYNPARHQERYDPKNAYVRRHVPELARSPTSTCASRGRCPRRSSASAGCVIGKDYPEPIVDHGGRARRRSSDTASEERVGREVACVAGKPQLAERGHTLKPASGRTRIVEVQMPQMGESVTEGTILEWHVAEGQEVSEGDTVVEVSTDKIDAEVPAPATGVVTKILAQPDDTVEVGQVLAQIDPNGTASGNGGDPSPLKEADGLVMGGGEGDEDLGDDDVASDPRSPARSKDAAPADPAVPGGEAEEAGGDVGF